MSCKKYLTAKHEKPVEDEPLDIFAVSSCLNLNVFVFRH
jgi:hypothetical protein